MSGSFGTTLESAAQGVPHNQIRQTTVGAIRRSGGTIRKVPERTRSGAMNDKHVDICLGRGPCPFKPPEQNPVPKARRVK